MVVMSDLRESSARKTPSLPSGARPATHADCRGDQMTSPKDMRPTHSAVAATPGKSTRGSGEIAMIHRPGSMTCNRSRVE
eukprot:scaffold45007_cov59-Phaeocystis_antarctica.AAC.9